MRELRLGLALVAVVLTGLACNSETPKPAETSAPTPVADAARPSSTTNAPTTSGQPAVSTPPATATGKDTTQKEIVTPTGLHYIDVKIGTGREAKSGDTVKVAYTGTLANGTKFDSSFDHPGQEPYALVLGAHKVIPGWEEGVAGMRKGGKRKLIVPAALGYGESGFGPIPPDATLNFDVELVAIQ